ncbi:DNA-3-methyladenine glycosylase [Dechloromonas sp. ZY10]|uniref:DNA-3-methyladenine glycosylase family protein n=1 Tax=Dechloromonas aquae TaxID=2664436 RepID=UPI0035289E15
MPPAYWRAACAELSDADPVLARLIATYPGVSLQSRGDVFGTLARSIVGQQISVKAADSVWARFVAQVGEVAPPRLLALGFAGLDGCGLSLRKREYLLDLAGHFVSGQLDPGHWPQLDDAAIIGELTAVRGIGRWTAEMFLIFNLMRPDVYPLDDIGLQRAVGRHYLDRDKATRAELVELGQRWRPWRSVATWYLWRSLDPVPVEY